MRNHQVDLVRRGREEKEGNRIVQHVWGRDETDKLLGISAVLHHDESGALGKMYEWT